MLTIVWHGLHKIAPGSGRARRLERLIDAHPQIPSSEMGFPEDWKRSPLWSRSLGRGSRRAPTRSPRPDREEIFTVRKLTSGYSASFEVDLRVSLRPVVCAKVPL